MMAAEFLARHAISARLNAIRHNAEQKTLCISFRSKLKTNFYFYFRLRWRASISVGNFNDILRAANSFNNGQ